MKRGLAKALEFIRPQLEADEKLGFVAEVRMSSAKRIGRSRFESVAYLGLTSKRLLIVSRYRKRESEVPLRSLHPSQIRSARDMLLRPILEIPLGGNLTRFSFSYPDADRGRAIRDALLEK
jgi:hypothetical protein